MSWSLFLCVCEAWLSIVEAPVDDGSHLLAPELHSPRSNVTKMNNESSTKISLYVYKLKRYVLIKV